MGAGRYSAGRIFLQVVPSFKNLQRETKREVDKLNRSMGDSMEKQGDESGARAGRAAGKSFLSGFEKAALADQRKVQSAWNKALIDLDKMTRASYERSKKSAEKVWKDAQAKAKREGDAARRAERKARLKALEDMARDEQRAYDEAARRTKKRGRLQAAAYAEDTRRTKAALKEQDRVRRQYEKDWERLLDGREATERKALEKMGRLHAAAYAEDRRRTKAALAEQQRLRDKAVAEAEKAELESMRRRGGNARREIEKTIKSVDRRIGTLDLAKGVNADLDRIRRKVKDVSTDLSEGLIDPKIARARLLAYARELDKVRRRGRMEGTEGGNVRSAVRDIRDMNKSLDDANRRGGIFSRMLRGATGGGDDGANAFRIFNYRVLAVASSLPLLVPLLAVTAGALVALATSALGAAAGLGVMFLAFSGVGEAVKALGDVQDNAAKDALAYRKTMRTAARGVRDAQQGLTQARLSAARGAEEANRRIADAEERLADSQRDATKAQQELREARAAAQKDQEDLADKIAAGALDERQALIDLFEAQVAYNSAMASGGATNLEKEQLSINLERARLALKGIRGENADLRTEQQKSDKAGVEGSERVLQAKEREADTTKAQRDAERDLADARRDAGRQAADSAVAIRDAQERLGDAQEAYNEALTKTGDIGSASMQKLEQAMGKLSPAGRTFALYIFSLQDGFRRLRDVAQEGMLPGLQESMEGIINRYGPGFTRFVGAMSKSMGDFFVQVGEVLQSPVWESFFAMMEKNGPLFSESFGTALLNIATGFAGIMTAFEPFSVDFANAMVTVTESFAEWASKLGESEGFQSFLAYLEKTGPKVWDLLEAIVGAFVNLGIALAPMADKFLDLFIGFFETIANMDPETLAFIATAILGFVLASQVAAGVMQTIITLTTPFHSVLGLVAYALVGLALAIVWAYQHWDTFRDVVDKVVGFIRRHKGLFITLAGVIATVGGALFGAYKIMSIFIGKAAAAWKVLGWVGRAFGLLTGPIGLVVLAIGLLVAGLVWAYNNVDWFRAGVDAAFSFIGKAAMFLWEHWFKPYFTFLWNVIKTIGEVIWWLWSDVAGPVFELIGAIIGKVFNDIILPAFKRGWEGFKILGGFLQDIWMDYINPVLDKFGLGVDDLSGIFSRAVEAMKGAWETLKEGMAAPIRWVIDTVINKGFVANFNKLADYFGTSHIPELSLSIFDKAVDRKSYSGKGSHGVGGYAAGGYTGPGAKYQPAGVVHADEYVIRKESTNKIRSKYGLEVLDYVNRFGDLPGMGGYANGGLVAFGKRLQKMGFSVTEHPAFGGVNGSHSRTGWHYRGGAIDVNLNNGQRQSAEETARLNAVVGLAKTYGLRTLWQWKGHYDHAHFDIDKGPDLGNFAGARGGRASGDTPWWVEKPLDLLRSAVGKLTSRLGDNLFSKFLKSVPNKLIDFAEAKITEWIGGAGDYSESGDGGGFSAGVNQWRDEVVAALRRVGQPTSLADVVLRRLNQESSGDPRAVNRWDSNFLGGTPSKGLMQVIDPTFRTWRDPKLSSNIFDPMANIVASMRYAMNRYGSLEKAYNRPGGYADGGLVTEDGTSVPDNGTMMYDNGGYLPPGITQVVNLTGRPEPVFTADQFDAMHRGGGGGRSLIGNIDLDVNGSDLTAADVVGELMWELDRVTHGGRYAGWTD